MGEGGGQLQLQLQCSVELSVITSDLGGSMQQLQHQQKPQFHTRERVQKFLTNSERTYGDSTHAAPFSGPRTLMVGERC